MGSTLAELVPGGRWLVTVADAVPGELVSLEPGVTAESTLFRSFIQVWDLGLSGAAQPICIAETEVRDVIESQLFLQSREEIGGVMALVVLRWDIITEAGNLPGHLVQVYGLRPTGGNNPLYLIRECRVDTRSTGDFDVYGDILVSQLSEGVYGLLLWDWKHDLWTTLTLPDYTLDLIPVVFLHEDNIVFWDWVQKAFVLLRGWKHWMTPRLQSDEAGHPPGPHPLGDLSTLWAPVTEPLLHGWNADASLILAFLSSWKGESINTVLMHNVSSTAVVTIEAAMTPDPPRIVCIEYATSDTQDSPQHAVLRDLDLSVAVSNTIGGHYFNVTDGATIVVLPTAPQGYLQGKYPGIVRPLFEGMDEVDFICPCVCPLSGTLLAVGDDATLWLWRQQ